jgi:hypothetical protein
MCECHLIEDVERFPKTQVLCDSELGRRNCEFFRVGLLRPKPVSDLEFVFESPIKGALMNPNDVRFSASPHPD